MKLYLDNLNEQEDQLADFFNGFLETGKYPDTNLDIRRKANQAASITASQGYRAIFNSKYQNKGNSSNENQCE